MAFFVPLVGAGLLFVAHVSNILPVFNKYFTIYNTFQLVARVTQGDAKAASFSILWIVASFFLFQFIVLLLTILGLNGSDLSFAQHLSPTSSVSLFAPSRKMFCSLTPCCFLPGILATHLSCIFPLLSHFYSRWLPCLHRFCWLGSSQYLLCHRPKMSHWIYTGWPFHRNCLNLQLLYTIFARSSTSLFSFFSCK